jgi:antirestriction protein ArdC
MDVYEQVTNKIIENLEAGKWEKPWFCTTSPVNGKTGHYYTGINRLLFGMVAEQKNYTSPEWFTFKQAKELGGNVKKGEKALLGIFFTKKELRDAVDENGEKKYVSVAKSFYVFNREQCENLPEQAEIPKLCETERDARLENFIADSGASIHYGGDKAVYIPSEDLVRLPRFENFMNVSGYYATAFHELAHWTGHRNRLDRDLTGRFGSESYAMEELVAELTSAFICADFELQGKLQHAEYISSWIKVLKKDKKAIVSAAAAAEKAAQYLKEKA